MEITFKNLDKDYSKGLREYVGDIQPKFWYHGRRTGLGSVVVKRQSSEHISKNRPRSPMFNHVGEYFGYLLAEKAGVKACPVDLVTLHDHKNKYSPTIKLFTACASHNLKKPGTILMPGEIVLARLGYDGAADTMISSIGGREGIYRDSIYVSSSEEDNVDLVIASIVRHTITSETNAGKRTSEEIQEDVKQNVQDAMDMIVFDCIFGNHDRHSGNWAMEEDDEIGRTTLYSAYDNEAVLGFRRSVAQISNVLENEKTMEEETNNILFSRMTPGKKDRRANYKDMLDYLVEKYPEYALPSILKITSRVDEKYVESLYDAMKGISQRGEDSGELSNTDELPDAYKYFGMEAFKARRNYALSLLRTRPNIEVSPSNKIVITSHEGKNKKEDEGLQLA